MKIFFAVTLLIISSHAFADETPIYSESWMGQSEAFYARNVGGLPMNCLRVENNISAAMDINDLQLIPSLKGGMINLAQRSLDKMNLKMTTAGVCADGEEFLKVLSTESENLKASSNEVYLVLAAKVSQDNSILTDMSKLGSFKACANGLATYEYALLLQKQCANK